MLRNFLDTKLLSKKNLYAQSLVLMLVILVTIVISSHLVFGYEKSVEPTIPMVLLLFFSLFQYILINLVNKLGVNDGVVFWLRWYPVYAFITGGVSIYSDLAFLGGSKPHFYMFFHIVNTTLIILFLTFIFRDIFNSKETHTDHIWGATLAYFLLILLFSEAYEIITIYNPGYLGKSYVMGLPNYVHCIMFSVNTMSGLDSLYPDANMLLRSIASLENVVGNLFLVIILGRLLSHPLKVQGSED
ncbi:MAG: hypothetical protein JXQ96_02195 [Cyclobacteriaceae bacterium]